MILLWLFSFLSWESTETTKFFLLYFSWSCKCTQKKNPHIFGCFPHILCTFWKFWKKNYFIKISFGNYWIVVRIMLNIKKNWKKISLIREYEFWYYKFGKNLTTVKIMSYRSNWIYNWGMEPRDVKRVLRIEPEPFDFKWERGHCRIPITLPLLIYYNSNILQHQVLQMWIKLKILLMRLWIVP